MKRLDEKSDREVLEDIHAMLEHLMGDVPAARAILHDKETRAELEALDEAGNAQIEHGLAKRREKGLIRSRF